MKPSRSFRGRPIAYAEVGAKRERGVQKGKRGGIALHDEPKRLRGHLLGVLAGAPQTAVLSAWLPGWLDRLTVLAITLYLSYYTY